jgi:hypothetical protein
MPSHPIAAKASKTVIIFAVGVIGVIDENPRTVKIEKV